MCYIFNFSTHTDFFHQNHSNIRKKKGKERTLQTAVFTPGLKEE